MAQENHCVTNYSTIAPLLKNAAAIQTVNNALMRFYSKSKSTKHHREYISDSDSDSDLEDERPKGKKLIVSIFQIFYFFLFLYSKHVIIKLIHFLFCNGQGESDFWRRKMRTLHSLLDVNNDGVISYDDFQILAENFVALGHLNPDAEKEFREVLQQTWEAQFGEITPYNLVNAEQYLTEIHNAVNDKGQRDRIHAFLPYLFKVC